MRKQDMYFQLKKEQENNSEVYCSECKTTKYGRDFYKRLIKNESYGSKSEDLIKVDLPVGICKECFMNKYFKYLDDNNGDIKKSIYKLCKEYNLPYDENIIDVNNSCSGALKNYIKNIHSNQYKDMDFHSRKVYINKTDSEKEKSDIDFINDDIKQIKINIQKALENEDVNQHGKWLNSLRDALTLREDLKRLEDNNTYDLYFDWSIKGDNTTEAVIMFKGEVHRIIRDDINAIAKYIYELCYKTNVYIYGDTCGIGMGIADCLSELGLIVSPTKIRANIFTKDKLNDNERVLKYRDYDEKVLNRIN